MNDSHSRNTVTLRAADRRLSRRHFVRGLVAGGLMAGVSPAWRKVLASGDGAYQPPAPEIKGTLFDLVIGEMPVNFTGALALATTINGSLPAPTLRWREGDTVTIRVTNRLRVPTSIHWHGIILPYQMDGVPGVSFPGIAPGETFTYRFTLRQSGTYWYHSHSDFQEMTGIFGAIIIEPRDGERIQADREHTLLLSEWTDEDPLEVFTRLKSVSHVYNFNQPTLSDFLRDTKDLGLKEALEKRRMFSTMRMMPTDLSDVSAATMTYLTNGITPAGNWTGLYKAGERVRLRIINGAGNTFFDVRIPGLPMTVVQTDGINVEPVTVDEFRCAPGETYDVVVTPMEDAYALVAETMERTGFALGTLAVRRGLHAPVPPQREAQWLSMTDMMGSMSHDSTVGSTADDARSAHGGHGASGGAAAPTVRHASTEFGASTDMRIDRPRTNLDDPGVGLRDAGHRVLTLADLHSIDLPHQHVTAERDIELHLTGNMERYSWSIDGLEYGRSTPIHFRHNERLRVILHNDTMMAHPMHLHGMWSDLETADGHFLARKHTLVVQPAQRIQFQLTADALGRWAWHCHLMFHMDAGMFREVIVS